MVRNYAFSILLLTVLLTSPVLAQEAINEDKIIFAPSMEHAKMEAKERNCPIFAFAGGG